MTKNRAAVLIVAGLAVLSACTPAEQRAFERAVQAQTSVADNCPTVEVAQPADYYKERDFLGRWEQGGYIRGFSQVEDGLVYYTRWCALHMPIY
jgi:hypothetical protein